MSFLFCKNFVIAMTKAKQSKFVILLFLITRRFLRRSAERTPCALISELLTQMAFQRHAEAKVTLLSNPLFPIFNYLNLSFRQTIQLTPTAGFSQTIPSISLSISTVSSFAFLFLIFKILSTKPTILSSNSLFSEFIYMIKF